MRDDYCKVCIQIRISMGQDWMVYGLDTPAIINNHYTMINITCSGYFACGINM